MQEEQSESKGGEQHQHSISKVKAYPSTAAIVHAKHELKVGVNVRESEKFKDEHMYVIL